MRKITLALLIMVLFSSCYTSVVTVGNCKYYYRRPIGSLHRVNSPRF